ncbi:Alpha-ketoglutarate-dependent dioxygenase alkB 2 [Rhizophlyctis rosea]|nr:Alpha-ketoglutarate-dependent dioxygenase alkB 2 [Rhizophlyctis rosea]
MPGMATRSAGKRKLDAEEDSKPLNVKDSTSNLILKKPKLSPSPSKATKPSTTSPAIFDNTLHPPVPAPTFSIPSGVSPRPPLTIKKKPDLDLLYFKPFLTPAFSKTLYTYLLQSLPWHRVQYRTRGMDITTPRYTTVFGIDESGAPLSAYDRRPRAIPTALELLKNEVEKATDEHYTHVLVNFYSNGQDSISYHSDDESFLGPLPTIASLSLGSSRDFLMRHKVDKTKNEKFVLESGDMVVMRGKTQSEWLHAVPKRKNAGGRINITFRRAVNVKGTNNYYRYNVGDGGVLRWDAKAGIMVPVVGWKGDVDEVGEAGEGKLDAAKAEGSDGVVEGKVEFVKDEGLLGE